MTISENSTPNINSKDHLFEAEIAIEKAAGISEMLYELSSKNGFEDMKKSSLAGVFDALNQHIAEARESIINVKNH